MKLKDEVFGVLQRVGRSFMLPIAILPVAGLFLGIGGSFTNKTMIEAYGLTKALGPGTVANAILSVMSAAGDIVFGNLPMIFAIGVAIGMARREKEVAALAGAISFFIMHASISAMLSIMGTADSFPSGSIVNVVGIESLQMGVFGGIIVGLGVAALHNRFYKIKLPQVFSFFEGTRFVPIVCAITYLVVGILMYFVWPIIQEGIYAVGDVVRGSGYLGTFVYGWMERVTIPFGLHHVFYLPFWQTSVGGTLMVDGTLVEGAQNIFFAQLASPDTTQFSVEATRFMSGKFLLMIFGLPGAALAMYLSSKPEKRGIVGGLLLSAALTSMLTGITEPLEFTFLFVAPVLYMIHCVFAGLAYMLMHFFSVGVGMTFSGGFIDLFLFGILQGNARTNWIWVVIVGIVYFVVYFVVFKFLIQKMNLKTPGREDEGEETKLYTRKDVNDAKKGDLDDVIMSKLISLGLGGRNNISDVDCCATRLRCTVKEENLVREDILKSSGAAGVIKSGKGVQVIYGPRVAVIRSNFEEFLASGMDDAIDDLDLSLNSENTEIETTAVVAEKFSSPIKGRIADITEAPDAAFSGKMMGDGVVIFPESNDVFAPANVTILSVFPTNHAIGMETELGTEILLHIGINTVKLDGKGFNILVKEGDVVKKGDKIAEVDFDFIAKSEVATSIATPMVFTNLSSTQTVHFSNENQAKYDPKQEVISIK